MKKESLIQKNKYIILSFAVTLGLWAIIYFISGILVGSNTILRMDLYHQYCPLFAELYDRITSGDFSLYSWESGLGSSFWGNYFNYLSSPLGLIVMLFGHKNVPEAIAVMIMLKGAFSSGSFAYYLKKSHHNSSVATIGFSVLYSFCAYMLAYYWNIMWLDAMVILPILALGIEKIINNGKVWTYIGALAFSMFTNYYMSFMLCIFSVMYFIYYYACTYSITDKLIYRGEKKKTLSQNRFLRAGVRFAFASLLAAGLMTIVLIPTYTILQSCSATSSSFPTDQKTYFNMFDFFINHISGLETTIRSSGDDVLPNVYCGVLTIILAPLYFFTKTIKKKEKICTIVMLAALYISFNFNLFNYIWHGFHFPNDLPYRFSFMYSFLLVVIAYKTFIRLNEFTSRQLALSGTALAFLILIVTKVESKNVSDRSVYISLVFVVIYVVLLTLFKDKRYEKKIVSVIMCLFIACEVIAADSAAIHNTISKESYEKNYDSVRILKDKLDTMENGDTSYRMELAYLYTRMDGPWYGYNSASVFSSMAYEATSKLEDRLGEMSNGINSYTYNPQTPVFNAMHAIKYVLNNESPDVFGSKYYKKVGKEDKFTAYKNTYYLPLAYGVNETITEWNTQMDDSANYVNPFIVQNDYWKTATGFDGVFENLNYTYVSYNNVKAFSEPLNGYSFNFEKETADTDGSATFYLKTSKAGNVYIFYNIDKAEDENITINGAVGTISTPATQDQVVDLGYYNAGETITINVPFEADSGSMRMYAVALNHDVFEKGYKKLADSQMNITKHEGDVIEGTIACTKKMVLYTSIPYDEGWAITVDGKQVSKSDYINIGGGLLGIKLGKGNHEIKMKYTVANLATSMIISVISLLVLLGIIIISLMKKKNGKQSKRPCFSEPHDYCAYYEIRAERKAESKKTESVKTVYIVPEKKKEFGVEVIKPPKKEFIGEIIKPPADATEETEQVFSITATDNTEE